MGTREGLGQLAFSSDIYALLLTALVRDDSRKRLKIASLQDRKAARMNWGDPVDTKGLFQSQVCDPQYDGTKRPRDTHLRGMPF